MPIHSEQHRDMYIRYPDPMGKPELEGGDVHATIKITNLHTVEETKALIELVSKFTESYGPVERVNIDGYGVVYTHWHKRVPAPPAEEGWRRYYAQPMKP